MKVLDIFSWLPEKDLSLDKIEEIVISLQNGVTNKEDYFLDFNLPTDANENVINASQDLIAEGKRVCYLIKTPFSELWVYCGSIERNINEQKITV